MKYELLLSLYCVFLISLSYISRSFKVNGHLRVPYYYVIPDNKTGIINMRIRRKKPPPQLLFNETVIHNILNDTVIHNIPTVLSINNVTCTISEYPSELHGLRLGLRVARIRKGTLYNEFSQQQKLIEALGIPFIQILNSNSKLITQNLINNDNHNLFPVSMMDKNNNNNTSMSNNSISNLQNNNPLINNINTKSTWSSREFKREQNFQQLLIVLQVHYDLFGDLLVPRYFKVPPELPWPVFSWGWQLGNRMRNIKVRRAYNESRYHLMLEDIGYFIDE